MHKTASSSTMGNKGLSDIVVKQTEVSYINGETGKLVYAGHDIEALCKNNTYETVIYLLWHKKLPTSQEYESFRLELANAFTMTEQEQTFIAQSLTFNSDASPTQILETFIAVSPAKETTKDSLLPQALYWHAKAAAIIATAHRIKCNDTIITQPKVMSYTENYLYMLRGVTPDQSHVAILETYFMLAAEHDLNASTFATMITNSTQANFNQILLSGIATLTGPIHGGAIPGVIKMYQNINRNDIEGWMQQQLQQKKSLMGFGHRIYKAQDPRAQILKEKLIKHFGEQNEIIQLFLQMEQVGLELLKEKGVKTTNIDFWASAAFILIELPLELGFEQFVQARIVGWAAHAQEQLARKNTLIRPITEYIGKLPLNPSSPTTFKQPAVDNKQLTVEKPTEALDEQKLHEYKQ